MKSEIIAQAKSWFVKICFVILLLSIGTSAYLYKRNQDLKQTVSDQTINIKALNLGMITYKDKEGAEHSASIQKIQTIQELKQANDSLYNSLLLKSKDAGVKEKDIVEAGVVQTNVVHDVKIKYIARDTIYDLSVRPHLIETIAIAKDTLSRHLEVFNTQGLVWHKKRETIAPPKKLFFLRWFQKKQDVIYVDITNSNPFIKTTAQTFTIINK